MLINIYKYKYSIYFYSKSQFNFLNYLLTLRKMENKYFNKKNIT